MKKFSLLLFFLSICISLWAEPVSESTALRVAENWYLAALERHNISAKGDVSLELLRSSERTIRGERVILYRVYQTSEGKGFVIVSGDDRVLPILGYALSSPFAESQQQQPEAFRKWMEYYQKQIRAVIYHNFPADETIERTWSAYLNGDIEKTVVTVDPLVSTKWDQPFPYNALCPTDPGSGGQAVVGCVATAMAQIMRYHAFPAQGTGFHSYNHPQFGTISANFGATTYNWANMPNSVSSFNEDVARLSFHCGVSIEMGYGVDVSGVSSLEGVSNALKQNFSYSNTTSFVQRENYSDANWLQLMKDELDASRPVEYAGIGQGGGHAWVMDGYDVSNFFHMNWGWSGYQDGYFTLNNLNPSTGGTGAGNSGFNYYQQAVVGIKPASGGGGGGGGGDPDPTAYTNLAIWSNVSANPYPIDFAQPFEVTVDVANLGSGPVTGDIAAAIFASDGTFLDFVDTESGTLDNGFFYTLTFSNDGLPTSPGTYQMGFFFRPTGGEYTIIPAGDYANPVSFQIQGPDNDIQLYGAIQASPDPIVVGEAFQITVDYANFGFSDFSGQFSMDLYTLDGQYIQEIDLITADLCSNCHFTDGLTFSSTGIDVEPGTYLIATWDRPNNGNWQIVATGDFENPIRVQVQAPALVGDPFEANNTEGTAYDINPFFSNNIAFFESQGSNMHEADDEDYYSFDVDPNYKYTISARVHDSYDSGNGITYTNDVLFGINDGSGWSDLFDDTMDGPFVVNANSGVNTVTFGVASYFVGTLGTYLLEVEIERELMVNTTQNLLEPFISIGPNPGQGLYTVNVELDHSANIQAKVFTITGQEVQQFDFGKADVVQTDIDLRGKPSGTYILLLDVDGEQYRKRLVLTK